MSKLIIRLETDRIRQGDERAIFDNTAAHVLFARDKVWNSLIDFYLMFFTICRGGKCFSVLFRQSIANTSVTQVNVVVESFI